MINNGEVIDVLAEFSMTTYDLYSMRNVCTEKLKTYNYVKLHEYKW